MIKPLEQVDVGHSSGTLLLATDAARRPECRASAWRLAVPAVVQCQCLHANGTAAAKLSNQKQFLRRHLLRRDTVADSVLANDRYCHYHTGHCLHKFMYTVCNKHNSMNLSVMLFWPFCFLRFDLAFLRNKKRYRSCFLQHLTE